MAAMSIFFICIIASNARLAAARSGSVTAFVNARGVICQDRPHLSLHQPHARSSPPLLTSASPYNAPPEAGVNGVLSVKGRRLGPTLRLTGPRKPAKPTGIHPVTHMLGPALSDVRLEIMLAGRYPPRSLLPEPFHGSRASGWCSCPRASPLPAHSP
jgi:hypothetical protein